MRSWMRKLFTHPTPSTINKTRRPIRLVLEALEDRSCPAIFTVTSALDDGSDGTLRWAVAQANANAGADTIDFDFSTPQTITLSIDQLQLTDTTGRTTISGSDLTVSGGGLYRVFQVDAGVSASISGLTITGGAVIGNGGGLYNLGNTTLTECIVTGNHAVGGVDETTGAISGVGGGIANKGGTLELIDCTISGNTADLAGGGVANAGIPAQGGGKGSAATPEIPAQLDMTDCTVTGNAAGVGSGVVNGVPQLTSGGGKGSTTVQAVGAATLNMHQCVISDNLALEDGGSAGADAAGAGFGVANMSHASLTDCTISGNAGGGVFNGGVSSGGGKGATATSATLMITNSTIRANLAPEAPPSGGGKGATTPNLGFGVANLGNATLTNSTISGNATGGVYNNAAPAGGGKGATFTPALTMINCTVSDHLATVDVANSGFGVLNSSNIALTHSTISGNDGGVNNLAGAAVLRNTIVAGNTTADLQGTGFSGSNNLIGEGGSAELTDGVDGNIVGVATADLHLAPLGDYGGPTQTIALQPGSPAIGVGAPVIFTTLTADIANALVTTITVASTAGLGAGLYIQIDSEIMRITGVTGATTLTVARGQLGTTAAPHSIAGPSVDIALAADQTGVAYLGVPDIGAFEAVARPGPTATIVVADDVLTIDETSLVTFTFNKPVADFTNDDLTVANGTLSAVSSSDGGVTWTATFTPTAGIDDPTNVITLDNAGVADLAGNAGTGTTDSNNYAIDTRPGTSVVSIVRTTPAGQFTSAGSVIFTVSFADPTLGLTASNFDLTGTAGIDDSNIGTVATSDGGSTWTVTIDGLAGADGTLILNFVNNSGLDHIPDNLPFTGEAYTLDSSAPTVTGVPNDGTGADVDIQSSTTTLNANWAGVFNDAVSGISGYEWKVGTTPGGSELFDFTTTGITGTSATMTGLALTSGQTYFVTVRAANAAGLEATATSDGVTVLAVPSGKGNVTAKINSQGILVINGNTRDNVVLIDAGPTADTYVVSGSGTRVNGLTGPQTISGAVNGIKVNLGNGNDTLLVGTDGPLTITGALTIIDKWRATSAVQLANKARTAADTVLLANLTVTGATSINLGIGNDQAEILDAVFSDTFNLNTASGRDSATITDMTFASTAVVRMGSGNDSLAISGSTFAQAATLNLGGGTDRLDAGVLATPLGATRDNVFVDQLSLLGIEIFLS